MENIKNVLSPEDVAAEAGLCRKTVYILLREGKIPSIKAGSKYLISRANFNKWINGENK